MSVIVPDRLTDQVCQLRKILGQIGSKEADLKAGNRAILKLALDAGDRLIAIKGEVGHGKFGAWVKANVACTARTATRYMHLAEGRALIEDQIGHKSDLSIRGALRLLNPKKPTHPKKDGFSAESPGRKVNPPAKLSEEERARITAADVPAAVKVEITQHAVNQERLSINARLVAMDRFIESIRSTEATQASEERKDADKLAKLAAFIKADRAKPVRDRIDRKASCFIDTAVVSPNPSDPDYLDTPGFLRRDPPPTIN